MKLEEERKAQLEGAKEFVRYGWGRRCKTKNSDCIICQMYEYLDDFLDSQSESKGGDK